MNTLFYLIIYDLPSTKAGDKRRKRLFDLLSGYGTWKQFSVFECFLTTKQFAKLQTSIEKLIKPDEDAVCIYILDATAVKKAIAYGTSTPEKPGSIIL
ncbi:MULTISPECIES: CRISPR-associated endonuclease Cas2 [Cyanophyceae]|uniref:CRISPR-associated endonuclease Cas2 n=1 Tax=Cyanophyceae TaxID=3028117 RepID=UPI00016DCE0F|nr:MULTISPECIES: CRISPR-associated endonuclease Cas2 [Cyanophyceae]ACB00880.1 CRISPR-associated protein Cas2 [Picosynechococcus sp. PCC 7002]ANV92128.1 CRISPR-associated endonuclease Cas2 [Picosynechococcus sp. PCC 8807]SMH59008.1 CRISPR-associated protein Cas2 [Picosynechococcus sp. OG1]SMQ86529.1 CRISPR-associated protein Cas2 [Synechococcus sp. 7002]